MVIPELLVLIILIYCCSLQTVPFTPSSTVIAPTTGIRTNELERRDER
jgi:hypothetical protein